LSDQVKKSVPARSPLSLKSAAGRFFLLGLVMGVLILPALASFGMMLPDWMNR
jgi:hypothetical protein